MVDAVETGSADGRFCGVFAAAMMWDVTQSHFDPRYQGAGQARPGRKGAQVPEWFGRVHTQAFAVAVMLGLLEEAPQQTPGDYLRALTMDADAMPGYLAATFRNGSVALPRMTEAFVSVSDHYGRLPSERSLFLPPPCYVRATQSLGRRGYTGCVGDHYRWTDQVGPHMQAATLWNEQLQPYPTPHREAEDAEAELAWRTMPDTIRRTCFGPGWFDRFAFIRILALSWYGGTWHPFRQPDAFELSGQVTLAKRIKELVDEAG